MNIGIVAALVAALANGPAVSIDAVRLSTPLQKFANVF
jgi:hypothetical protein